MKQVHTIAFAMLMAAFTISPRLSHAQNTVETKDSLPDQNVSTPAEASTDLLPAENDWWYAMRFSQRALTMQRGMLRANGIVTVWDDGVDTIVGLDVGGAIGVTENFEVGISNYRVGSSLQHKYEGLVSVVFTPNAGFGDIPVYGRYRFLQRNKVEIAGDLVFVIPTGTAFALEAGVPIRIKANNKLSVDTGTEVRGTFGAAKRADIRVPAILNYSFSNRAFIGGETGLYFVNMGKKFDTTPDLQGIAIPFGFRAGGTWRVHDKSLIDLFSGFSFTQLIEAGTSRKTIDFGIWDIFVGVTFYAHPVF